MHVTHAKKVDNVLVIKVDAIRRQGHSSITSRSFGDKRLKRNHTRSQQKVSFARDSY